MTAFNDRANASMRAHFESRNWPEEIASIERMNEAAKIVREGMRKTRKASNEGPREQGNEETAG